MNAKMAAEHLEFYQWIRRTFPKTPYTMGSNFTGVHFGEIGFSHPMGGLVRLHYRNRAYNQFWNRMELEHDFDNAYKQKTITDEHYATFKRERHQIAFHLIYWKANVTKLTEYCGIGADIRQLARLAVILDYKPDQRRSQTDATSS